MSPAAKTTVKRAITPSTSAVVSSLESTVMAAVGRTHAMMVATEEVNCSIRCPEYVLRVVAFSQLLLDACVDVLFRRVIDSLLSSPSIGRFSTSDCCLFRLLSSLRKFCQNGTNSSATQRVRPSTFWPERGTIRSSLFSSGFFDQTRLRRRRRNCRLSSGGLSVNLVRSPQLCEPGPLICLLPSPGFLSHLRRVSTLKGSASGNAVI